MRRTLLYSVLNAVTVRNCELASDFLDPLKNPDSPPSALAIGHIAASVLTATAS